MKGMRYMASILILLFSFAGCGSDFTIKDLFRKDQTGKNLVKKDPTKEERTDTGLPEKERTEKEFKEDGIEEEYLQQEQPCITVWTPTRNLSNNPGISRNSDVAVDGDNVHVVWQDDTPGNNDILYKRSVDNGATWSSVMNLSKTQSYSNNPSIATDGRNVHLVWADSTGSNVDIFYKRSIDNGLTWSKPRNLSQKGHSSKPYVSAHRRNVHVSWQDTLDRPGDKEIRYRMSADNGSTWTRSQNLSGRGLSILPAIASDGGKVHLAWQENVAAGTGEVLHRRSVDGGSTWTQPQNLSNTAGNSRAPSIAANGYSAHALWRDDSPGSFGVLYSFGKDSGAVWMPARNLYKGQSDSPSIAASGANVHAAWVGYINGGSDILYRSSTDNGAGWGPVQNLSDNAVHNQNPSLAANGCGVHAVWTDDVSGNSEIYYRGRVER